MDDRISRAATRLPRGFSGRVAGFEQYRRLLSSHTSSCRQLFSTQDDTGAAPREQSPSIEQGTLLGISIVANTEADAGN
jgi:hypothetical protein